MLNKIILFLWKIRVCLLCFEMFGQGHSTRSGPAGDGTGGAGIWDAGRSRISGFREEGGFWGVGGLRDLGVQGGGRILGCRGEQGSPCSPPAPLLSVPEGAQGPITAVTRDIHLF